MSTDWKFLRVLPNICLARPIENKCLAIVPHNDDRLRPLRNDRRVIRLLDNFTDAFSRAIAPSALLVRADAPESVGMEAVIAFRNSVAINAIAYAWMQRLNTHNTVGTQWSDYWDIYPTGLGNGEFLVTNSPAAMGIDDHDDFKGQCSPYISSPMYVQIGGDNRLTALLDAARDQAYLQGSAEQWRHQCLFRSMAMAYQACRIQNSSLIYDFGTGLGLWVSAFECLTHTGLNGRAGLITVLDLLKQVEFKDPALQGAQFTERIRKNDPKSDRQMNLAEHLYWQLYQTRNDFLHGNPVTAEALFAFRNTPVDPRPEEAALFDSANRRALRRPTMESLMPLVYRLALLEFLKPAQAAVETDDDVAYEILTKPDFEVSLASALRMERRW